MAAYRAALDVGEMKSGTAIGSATNGDGMSTAATPRSIVPPPVRIISNRSER
jgi:hypothetical protein